MCDAESEVMFLGGASEPLGKSEAGRAFPVGNSDWLIVAGANGIDEIEGCAATNTTAADGERFDRCVV